MSRTLARWITAFAVAALLVAANVFGPTTPFPGFPAAIVCALVCVLLVVGSRGSILSIDAAAFIGRRSYAAYLWHWPLAAFLAYVQAPPHGVATAGLVVVVFVLSDLTYRWVERPGLAARPTLARAVAFAGVLPLMVSAGAYALADRNDGFPARLGAGAEHAYVNLRGFALPREDRCHGNASPRLEDCVFGDQAGDRTALLIGDSHAQHFRPFVAVLARQANVRLQGVTDDLCLALEGVQLPPRFRWREACGRAIERDFAWIRTRHFDFVVLGAHWNVYPVDQLDLLAASLSIIVASGATPVLIESVAEDGTDPHACFFRAAKLHRPDAGDCTIAKDNDFARSEKAHVATLFAAMRARFPTLRIIDPQAVQCDGERCLIEIDGTPIYRDTQHLDGFGSTMLGRASLARSDNPFAR